ncbi:MAG: hypothetical protein A2252_02270 [Elusimicrobia bacterium RIFOXYA2_FULL_39_19]|nr:MAG: hypothetical protein A2252_02270 [Elusimicrobia bacterium RIFOXYA2_FULL_39_19]
MKKIKYLIIAVLCLFSFSSVVKTELRNPVSNTGSESNYLVVEYGYGESKTGYTMTNIDKTADEWEKWEKVYNKSGTESFAIGGKYLDIFKQKGEPFSTGLWYQYEKLDPQEKIGGSTDVDDVINLTFTNGLGYIAEKRFSENFRITFQGEHKQYSFEKVQTSGIDRKNVMKLDFFKGYQGEAKRLTLDYTYTNYFGESTYSDSYYYSVFTFWRRSLNERWSLGLNMRRNEYIYINKDQSSSTVNKYNKENSYIMDLLWPSIELSFPEKGILKAVYTSFQPYKLKEKLCMDPKKSFNGFSTSFWVGTGFYIVDFPSLSFSASVEYSQHNFKNIDRKDNTLWVGADFSVSLFEHCSVGFNAGREYGDSSIDTEDEVYDSLGFSTKVWF